MYLKLIVEFRSGFSVCRIHDLSQEMHFLFSDRHDVLNQDLYDVL